jgi:hypothetical protein
MKKSKRVTRVQYMIKSLFLPRVQYMIKSLFLPRVQYMIKGSMCEQGSVYEEW